MRGLNTARQIARKQPAAFSLRLALRPARPKECARTLVGSGAAARYGPSSPVGAIRVAEQHHLPPTATTSGVALPAQIRPQSKMAGRTADPLRDFLSAYRDCE